MQLVNKKNCISVYVFYKTVEQPNLWMRSLDLTNSFHYWA